MSGKCFDFGGYLCAQYSLKVANNVLSHEYCVSVSSKVTWIYFTTDTRM